MFQTKIVGKIKTHILCSVTFPENRAVCEIKLKNFVERGRPHMAIWRMRTGCWIPKAIHTHTQNMQYLLLFHYNNGCTNVRCLSC